ncbi:MAG: hypothetical protein RI544_02285 [Haloquadratum sp.]|jgi:hypothetical protein|nr:hypothetical protein [Haloferacaceae archaeon]MDR9444970.1 hypothetical protein [Haloquadratum sp.]
METTTAASDTQLGLTIAFMIIAMLGVVVMGYYGATGGQLIAAVGFAVAMIAGSVAVSAPHLFG